MGGGSPPLADGEVLVDVIEIDGDDDLLVDDSLEPLDRLQAYHQSNNVVQRLYVAGELGDTATHAGGAAAARVLLPLLAGLRDDGEPAVRAAVAGQMVPVAAVLVGDGERQAFCDGVLQTVGRLARDLNPQVRQVAGEALAGLAGLCTPSELQGRVLPMVRQLADDESEEEYRVLAAMLVVQLMPLRGVDMEDFAVPLLRKLASDAMFRVRKAVATALSELVDALENVDSATVDDSSESAASSGNAGESVDSGESSTGSDPSAAAAAGDDEATTSDASGAVPANVTVSTTFALTSGGGKDDDGSDDKKKSPKSATPSSSKRRKGRSKHSDRIGTEVGSTRARGSSSSESDADTITGDMGSTDSSDVATAVADARSALGDGNAGQEQEEDKPSLSSSSSSSSRRRRRPSLSQSADQAIASGEGATAATDSPRRVKKKDKKTKGKSKGKSSGDSGSDRAKPRKGSKIRGKKKEKEEEKDKGRSHGSKDKDSSGRRKSTGKGRSRSGSRDMGLRQCQSEGLNEIDSAVAEAVALTAAHSEDTSADAKKARTLSSRSSSPMPPLSPTDDGDADRMLAASIPAPSTLSAMSDRKLAALVQSRQRHETIIEKAVLPVYLSLCRDDIWGVRKAGAESLVAMSRQVTHETRRDVLVPLYAKLVADDSRWVRSAAFEVLGPFVASFADDVVPVPKSLVDTFCSMAEPPARTAVRRRVGGSTLGGGAAAGALDNVHRCAFSFPAVLQTVGPDRWDELRDTYFRLANDVQWKVRRTIGFSIHVVGEMLGRDRAESELRPVFELYLRDLPEVQEGVLTSCTDFLMLLRPDTRGYFLSLLSEVASDPMNWRFRLLVARQLRSLVHLECADKVGERMVPIVQRLLVDGVAVVRHAAAQSVGAVLARLQEIDDGGTAAATFIEQLRVFATEPTFGRRQTFAEVCGTLCREMPLDQFVDDLLDDLLELADDRVPNVRLMAAEVLSMPELADAADVQTVVERLRSDRDRDVVEAAGGGARMDLPVAVDSRDSDDSDDSDDDDDDDNNNKSIGDEARPE